MECHKCPHNGKFAGVPFGETPCSKCRLSDGGSVGTVAYNDDIAGPCARYGVERGRPARALSGAMPVSVLATAVGMLLGLPPDDLLLVRARYHGETCPEIAARLGVGKFAVQYRLRKILGGSPALAKLVPVRARFGPKKKEAGECEPVQGRKPGK